MRKVKRKFKRLLLEIALYRARGFSTLVIISHVLLAWRLLGPIALIFTILWGIHFLFAFNNYLYFEHIGHLINRDDRIIFFISNIILILIGLVVNWWWTLLTIFFTYISFKVKKSPGFLALGFLLFLISVCLLPLDGESKVVIFFIIELLYFTSGVWMELRRDAF